MQGILRCPQLLVLTQREKALGEVVVPCLADLSKQQEPVFVFRV